MNIPVVFATDENYFFYTIVAITSMAENADRDTSYQIYLLVSGELEKGHHLLTEIQTRYSHIKINLLPIDHEFFQNVYINNTHVTKATFYRLLLGELLKEDKCLYLDSDIIVCSDLKELYSCEMDSAYIAGVRDLWIDLLTESDREKRRIKTNIPTMEQYINAGVLIFNLREIRRDHMVEKFCAHMGIDYPYEDQDIINVCCYNHIKWIPAKWNLFTLFMGQIDELEKKGISRDTLRHMEEKRGIIHYATPFIRPWESERFLCNDIWWKYAAIWSDTLEYQKLRRDVQQREIGYSKNKMIAYCEQYEQVFIWGFTVYGKKLFSMLISAGVKNIAAFFDNDREKQKLIYHGKKVLPFDPMECKEGKSAVLIASQRRGKELRQILVDVGMREEDIVQYIHKDKIYYQCLRPEFCKEER